ncbi:hypothetical protein SU69_07050 [Thermosipho melanesiensis]|uniref:Tetratricopeptide TPR_2 repeat protein n=2 Tax=Thermosipho melanesiensis TaxID=46541 RepID=A6LMT8_THEM4|nr:tetratricopeptide repeat protein [Thermosipho melanesiensis]ABR31239.1 Tetratricopeptide TPR_2 repeat protein [Thermosipho melanesiensis BI429]APT74323.1 hypothetical protein BW47_07375 [Thermosipho melanesiensis]OOC36263.1 hypothetical protein SU68_07120 [Thermosipho melanesiensis]OOC37081.1 hypothetical protein SU69_07050 [Thermosipho melanesiensis]OOC37833.1 hypothetical protein SU70_07060 [Thermosipho melanesiensis]
MKKYLLIFLLLIFTISFSFVKEAIEYYEAGINAYQQDNYQKALEYFEKALVLDPSIEGYDASLKFKAGICAFMIGNYDKAKAYLSSYTDNPIVNKLIENIQKNSTETSEWKNWIQKYHPVEVPATTTTEAKSNFKFILFLTTFTISFSILLFMEMRVWKAKKQIPSQEIDKPETPKTSSIIFENSEEFFPESAKATINFEDLLNKDLSFLSEFFDEKSSEEKISQPKEEYYTAEDKNPKKVEQEITVESEKNAEENLEEILEEINELEEIVSSSKEDKNTVESSLIEQIENIKVEKEEEEIPIERIEEFSNLSSEEALNLLDEKDELDEIDQKIITVQLKNFMLNLEETR